MVATLDYTTPRQSYFRYRLHGVEHWSRPTRERKVTYTNLDPGTYEFEAQASLDGQEWNPTSASLKLVVMPPWYGSWWARASGIAVLLLVTLGFIHWRIRSHAKHHLQREKDLEAAQSRAEAALAKELQKGMLLEKAVQESSGDDTLTGAARIIGDYFRASRLHIHVVTENSEGDLSLSFAAEYMKEGLSSVRETEFPNIEAPIFSHVLSDGLVEVSDINSIRDVDSSTEVLEALGSRSFLAVRTSYQERPNGIMVLHSGEPRSWTSDDIKLVQTISGHMGLAIAQIELSERESRQREDLVEAYRAADQANIAKSEFVAPDIS